MDQIDLDDQDQDYLLTRSNSWSHAQRPQVFTETVKKNSITSGRPNGLSCIYEMDDHNTNQTNNQDNHQMGLGGVDLRNRSKSVSGGGAQAAKKRRHSYTELIASAILSSPEKRKTLAEIYDWFVLNVPTFKDQRYMHSSLGWKNAVRHNLSVQTCFKRVKRHGMEKPSWWTVDMTEVAKRRLVLRPTASSTNSINGDAEIDPAGPFLPPRRNTYSGGSNSNNSQSVNREETNCVNKINYRVGSTNDLATPTSLSSFPNSNVKRTTHYAPIRPAIAGHMTEMGGGNVFGLNNSGRATPVSRKSSYGDMNGLNSQSTDDDVVFLKPCAIDSSPISHQSMNSPGMIPSVTLVCKDNPSPNQPYRQAQLEVSFQAVNNNDSRQRAGSFGSSPSSPNWPQQTPQITPGVLSNHFKTTWPVNAPLDSPNQTLRVKTLWGNVQDISFNGLLPVRTVVKCDGMTQTDESNEVSVISKNLNWSETEYDPQQFFAHDSALTAELPEDLAGLQIEGDLHCDIDQVMNSGLDQHHQPSSDVNKTSSWSWNNNTWNNNYNPTSLDQSPFIDEHLSNFTANLVQSPFNFSKMDVSEP